MIVYGAFIQKIRLPQSRQSTVKFPRISIQMREATAASRLCEVIFISVTKLQTSILSVRERMQCRIVVNWADPEGL